MGFHGQGTARKLKVTMPRAKRWLKHSSIGLTGVINHASLSGSLDKSRFGECQNENTIYRLM